LQIEPGSGASLSGQELINRIRGGERKLFHELVRPYERAIYVTAYAVLRNHADAEDVAQDTVLKAFTHLDQLQEAGKFKSWILRIAINEARLRRRAGHAHLYEALESGNTEGGEDQSSMPRDFADWREIPSDLLERREIRESIARGLEQLPEIYREVFVLRDVEELSVTEVATTLGIRETTVKVRLHRARLRLRELLAPVFKRRWTDRLPFWKGKNPW
jgi:RNA polymerase sigma-70 factor (ECF subfamily)